MRRFPSSKRRRVHTGHRDGTQRPASSPGTRSGTRASEQRRRDGALPRPPLWFTRVLLFNERAEDTPRMHSKYYASPKSYGLDGSSRTEGASALELGEKTWAERQGEAGRKGRARGTKKTAVGSLPKKLFPTEKGRPWGPPKVLLARALVMEMGRGTEQGGDRS